MASTIASNARTGQSGSWGARAAFATASALYVVLVDTSGVKIRVYKSTNGTTWTQQDSSNAITPTAATAPYSCWIASGVIYIAYYPTASSIRVGRFDTSTDTFSTVVGGGDAVPSSEAQVPGSSKPLRVTVRSDGDVILIYARNAGGTIHWTRYEGSSWAAVATFDSGSDQPNDLLMMSSDRALSLHGQDSANDHSYRTISSANALGTTADFDATVATTASNAFFGCTFNDGTNDKVALTLVDSTNELDFYHATQGEPLGSVTAVSGVNTAGNEPQLTGAAVETFNSKVYVCWSKANTVMYDSTTSLTTLTFGTDQTLVGSLTDSDPIPQFIKGLSGLGVIYNDNGAVKVEWITAPSTGATATITSGALSVTGVAMTASTGSVATVSTGTLAVTGVAMTATPTVAATVTPNAMSVTGQAVAATTGVVGTVTPQALAVTGQAVAATTGVVGTVTPQALAVTGQAVAATTGVVATVSPNAMSVAGQSVIGTEAISATVAAGALSVSGQSVAASTGVSATVTPNVMSVSGQTVTADPAVAASVGAGALATTGQAIAATTGTTATVSAGAQSVTGNAVAATVSVTGAVATGALSTTGQTVNASAGVTGTIAAGALSVTGNGIIGEDTGGEGDTGTIASGSLAVTGQGVAVTTGTTGSIAPGAYAVTGQAVSGVTGVTSVIAAGALSVAAGAIVGAYGDNAAIASGALTVTGNPIDAFAAVSSTALIDAGALGTTGGLIDASYDIAAIIEAGALEVGADSFVVYTIGDLPSVSIPRRNHAVTVPDRDAVSITVPRLNAALTVPDRTAVGVAVPRRNTYEVGEE